METAYGQTYTYSRDVLTGPLRTGPMLFGNEIIDILKSNVKSRDQFNPLHET